VFTYPQWLATGGLIYDSKQLAVDMLGLENRSLPTDMKGWEDIIPEGKCPHVDFFARQENIRSMFISFDLDAWFSETEQKGERKLTGYNLPEVKDYKITIDERKIVKATPKIPSIQVGINRITQSAKDLIQEVNKLNPAMRAVVRNYMTNFSPDLQVVAANMIFARLETGIDDEPTPFGLDPDSPNKDDEGED